MERSSRNRWRHTRNTIPARRRRRRTHRRDCKRGGTYYPMKVDPRSAQRGIRTRLLGAIFAAAITLICVLYAMLSSMGTFGSTFALTMGLCSFGAAVGLLLSARHEEEVHQLAADFEERTLFHDDSESQPRALPEPDVISEVDIFERPEMRGVRRESYSKNTDGVI